MSPSTSPQFYIIIIISIRWSNCRTPTKECRSRNKRSSICLLWHLVWKAYTRHIPNMCDMVTGFISQKYRHRLRDKSKIPSHQFIQSVETISNLFPRIQIWIRSHFRCTVQIWRKKKPDPVDIRAILLLMNWDTLSISPWETYLASRHLTNKFVLLNGIFIVGRLNLVRQ